MRHGFTLVELLVAIVVFTIGALALAGTAGLVAMHVGDGGRLTTTAHIGRSVLDSLRSLSCERAQSGSSSRGTVTATWIVSRDARTATIDLTIASPLQRRMARTTYSAVIQCAP
jgi:prepilin-type N-terminal cleavage/methylation domain-containing protein